MYYERSRALKRRMRAGETTFGAFLSFQDPGAAEIMAGTGYGWAFIDMEHSPFDLKSLQHVLMVSSAAEARVLEAQVAWARKGACFVVTGEDHGLLRRAAADALNRFRAALA